MTGGTRFELLTPQNEKDKQTSPANEFILLDVTGAGAQHCRRAVGASDRGMGVGEGRSLKPVNTESLLPTPVECAAQSASGDHVNRDLWAGDMWDGLYSTPEYAKVGTKVGTLESTDPTTLSRDQCSDKVPKRDSGEGALEEGMVGKIAERIILPSVKVDVAHNAISCSPFSPQPHSMEELVKDNSKMKSELEM